MAKALFKCPCYGATKPEALTHNFLMTNKKKVDKKYPKFDETHFRTLKLKQVSRSLRFFFILDPSLFHPYHKRVFLVIITVKLGYNEFMAITTKTGPFFGPKWSLGYINLHGYNEVTAITNKYGWSYDVRCNRVRLYLWVLGTFKNKATKPFQN